MAAQPTSAPIPTARPTGRRGFLREAENLVIAAATRRSRFVGIMKVALPVTALLLVGLLFIWPQLSGREDSFNLSYSQTVRPDDIPVMRNARFRGTDSLNRPFLVTAEQATQDPTAGGRIMLDRLSADLTMQDGSWLTLSADTGVYAQTDRLLQLFGNIAIYSDRGFEFHALTAEVNLDAGSVASDDKVWGHGPLGAIQANGLRVYDRGGRIEFTNGVKTTLFANTKDGAG